MPVWGLATIGSQSSCNANIMPPKGESCLNPALPLEDKIASKLGGYLMQFDNPANAGSAVHRLACFFT